MTDPLCSAIYPLVCIPWQFYTHSFSTISFVLHAVRLHSCSAASVRACWGSCIAPHPDDSTQCATCTLSISAKSRGSVHCCLSIHMHNPYVTTQLVCSVLEDLHLCYADWYVRGCAVTSWDVVRVAKAWMISCHYQQQTPCRAISWRYGVDVMLLRLTCFHHIGILILHSPVHGHCNTDTGTDRRCRNI